MDAVKFRLLRQIILDSSTFISRGVSFNTLKAHDKGYSELDIAEAEYLLTKVPSLQRISRRISGNYLR